MAYWKLEVEGFGKIKKAEIELAPMTLFVGDNNSGKSYLLSLAWAVRKFGDDIFRREFFRKEDDTKSDELGLYFREAIQQAEDKGSAVLNLAHILPQLEVKINQTLEIKKEQLMNMLFHSNCVSVEQIQMKVPENISGNIWINDSQGKMTASFFGIGFIEFSCNLTYEYRINLLLETAIECLLLLPSAVYMPAARTGFMMSKDIINKYAREKAFTLIETEERPASQTFSRPILDFLDVMNDLSQELDGAEAYRDIVSFIQREMTQGNVEISSLPSRELSYIPDGGDRKYPFRAASAVVTELAPLLLLLSHTKRIGGLFYEEPEMCLHPALQKCMGQVLARMVNAGIDVTATTHSDIILQHMNNMIRLSRMQKNPKDYGYETEDLIAPEKVRVYQMSVCKDGMTEVKELPCGENGFAVPTFNDALDELMEDVIQIQS